MRRLIVLMGWMLLSCVREAPGEARPGAVDRPRQEGAGKDDPRPVTVLFLPGFGPDRFDFDGLGPAVEFPVFEATPAAAFVQLAAGTALHNLFAERLVAHGREQPASSAALGVELPVTGHRTQVWAPRLGHVDDTEPGRWMVRPSRTRRARAEVVPCPGEVVWTDRDGERLQVVRVRGCPGPVRLDFMPPVGQPGPGGRITPVATAGLGQDQVGTWIWQQDDRWWAVSLGILKIEDGRVVWHREGPVADAVFGPADWIALRDGELDIHMQAGFIRGSLRALFAAIVQRPAPWTLAAIHPLADLKLALGQAPGSWEEDLLDEAGFEVQAFVRDRLSSGHHVALAGVGPVVPVTRVIPPEAFSRVDASAIVPGDGSVLFLWEDPGPGPRRRLEQALAQVDLTPDRNHHLYPVPGGYRLDLAPGTVLGRCGPGRISCTPRDYRGVWAAAPWFRGWLRMPAERVDPPGRSLSSLLRHLLKVVDPPKNPRSINQ
ncbi:hypothetical protein KJ975_11980 [Myxococcota bacterium]|nr:hypothetical protein [Myxococcota bacterium]